MDAMGLALLGMHCVYQSHGDIVILSVTYITSSRVGKIHGKLVVERINTAYTCIHTLIHLKYTTWLKM